METTPIIPDQPWMVIVNPNAGVKKGGRAWPEIQGLLSREKIAFVHQFTERKGHAIELVIDAIRLGYRHLAVVGGDGTLNEALNGIMLQDTCPVAEITLGIVPVGTGNDWCRMFRVPFDYAGAVRLLGQSHRFRQDIGKVTFFREGEQQVRYFMNVAGMGYDALVAKKTNLLKEKGYGGPLTYLWFVFSSLFQFRFMDAVIEVDGQTLFKGEIFSMNVGICRYNGGGMMQVPHAIPDDGLQDVTLIKKAPKWMVIRHAGKLYNGTLINLPIVRTFQGKTIRIRSTGRIYLETDGESMGHTPFTFDLLSRVLTVVTGDLTRQPWTHPRDPLPGPDRT